MIAKNKSIILFDGICNLCNTSVNFIIKHDKKNRFLFASLQSDAGQELLLQFNSKKNLNKIDSIVLIVENKIYYKSTAALQIAKQLKFPYNLLIVLHIIPKCLRDYLYGFIAKNRYKWFGKQDTCKVPNNELLDKFLL